MNRRSFLQIFGIGSVGCATLKAKKPMKRMAGSEFLGESDHIHLDHVPLYEREVWSVIEGNASPSVRRIQSNDFQHAFISQHVKYGQIWIEYHQDYAKNIFYWRKHEDYA